MDIFLFTCKQSLIIGSTLPKNSLDFLYIDVFIKIVWKNFLTNFVKILISSKFKGNKSIKRHKSVVAKIIYNYYNKRIFKRENLGYKDYLKIIIIVFYYVQNNLWHFTKFYKIFIFNYALKQKFFPKNYRFY